jgi:hypothetical protein
MSGETNDIKQKYAELQSKIQDCITWAENPVNERTNENKKWLKVLETHSVTPFTQL